MSARLGSLNAFKLGLLNALLVIGAVFFIHREVWRHLDLWPLLFDNWAENILFATSVVQGWITGAFPTAPAAISHEKRAQKWARRIGTPGFFFLYVASAGLCERLIFGAYDSVYLRALGVFIIAVSIALRIWSRITMPRVLQFRTISGATPAIATEASATPAIATEATATSAIGSTSTVPSEIAETTEEDAAAATNAGESQIASERSEIVEPARVSQTGAKTALEIGEPAEKAAAAELDNVKGPYKWVRFPDQAGTLLFLVGATLCFGAWMPLFALPGALVVLNWHLTDVEAFCAERLGEPYLRYKNRTKRIIPFLF